MKAITRKLVSDWREAASKTGRFEEQIMRRIDYVLRTWFEIYGANLEYWYFEGAAEGNVGDLSRFMSEYSIYNLCVKAKNFPDNGLIFINKNGDEYCWQSEIPTHWLYDDNFENEIRLGKEKYARREEERKAKKKQSAAIKKEFNDKLVAQAKSKLSKEELAALKKIIKGAK